MVFAKTNNYSLTATITATGESLYIDSTFYPDTSWNIESFKFTDATLSLSQLNAMTLTGDSGDNTLFGWTTYDSLTGGAGNDVLNGLLGKDTLNGGTGNDTLKGGANDDTYQFAANMGNDYISEQDDSWRGGTDQVVFTGLKRADVSFSKTNNYDLVATIKATGESLYIDAAFNPDTSWNVESFKFTDVVLSLTEVKKYINDVNSAPTGLVTIDDTTPELDQTLTVSNNLDDADGLGTITYQWKANNSVIGSGDSYTITDNEVGKAISVTASYTDGHGIAETVNSLTTSAVVDPTVQSSSNHAPTGKVTIAGSAVIGQTLTVTNTLSDADGLGTISYQWQASGINVGTGDSYIIAATDKGKPITVTASYTDLLGTFESVSSKASAPVKNLPSEAGVIISGNDFSTSEQGDTAVFAVSLNSEPSRDLKLNFTSSDTTEGALSVSSLTFTASNWNVPQSLTVIGQNDTVVDGDVAYSINATVATLDVNYKGLTINGLALSNKDTPVVKVEKLVGTDGIDTLQGTDAPSNILGQAGDDDIKGGGGKDTLYGSYGDDVISGDDGDDTLYGEQDADYLEGNAGNDILDGGLGLDTLVGGAGNDTYYLGYDAVDVIDDQVLAGDIDTIIMPYQLAKYTLPKGIETGTIAAGTQASNLVGNTSNNTLTGNDGKNVLSGAVGRDSLFGGAGSDVLNGGAGRDALSGGAGRDVFFFNSALKANVDSITDFKVVDDTIRLENAVFTKLTTTGAINAGSLVFGAAAADSNDYLVYNKTTGALFYDADANGAGAAVQVATLGVNLALTAADFVVV